MIHQIKQFAYLLTSASILIASFSCNAFQPSDVNGKEFYMGDKVLFVSIEGPKTYQSLKEITDAGFSLDTWEMLGISPGPYYSLTLKYTSKSSSRIMESVSSLFCTFSPANPNNLNCTNGLDIIYNSKKHPSRSSSFCEFPPGEPYCRNGLDITYNPENHSVTEKGSSAAYYEAGHEPK